MLNDRTKLKTEETLSVKVYSQLREDIIFGRIAQGEKLGEAELAERYGTSRAPLREAIRRLEEMGLSVRTPRAGSRVITLDTGMLRDIYQVRMALEGIAAGLAAKKMSKDDISSLWRLIEKHEDSVSRSHGKSYEQHEGNSDFHSRIYHASENQWLIHHLEGKVYHILQMSRHATAQMHSRPETALREHRHIMEALEAQDAELAEFLMRRHISGAWKAIEKSG